MNKQTTQAFAVLDTFAAATDASRTALVAGLTDAGIATREEADPIVTQWASLRTGCPLVDGQRKAAGRKVFDSQHPAFENARKTRQRVMDAFCPAEKPAQKEEAASAATVKKATKAEREAHQALQEARDALAAAEAAFALVCGSKARAKALDKALSA